MWKVQHCVFMEHHELKERRVLLIYVPGERDSLQEGSGRVNVVAKLQIALVLYAEGLTLQGPAAC